jgi:hypothetical protein
MYGKRLAIRHSRFPISEQVPFVICDPAAYATGLYDLAPLARMLELAERNQGGS